MSLSATIEKLRELNEFVPRPFRLPTEAEVATAERNLGVRFQPDYRYFLLHGSDIAYGTIEPAVVIPDSGHLDLVALVHTARKIGVADDLMPFCEDNGDYYCLTSDSRVVLWSHDGLSSGNWSDLEHWISNVWLASGSV